MIKVGQFRIAKSRVGLTVLDGHCAMQNLDAETKEHLLGANSSNWSGGVYPKALPDGSFLCILNPAHSRRRNRITLMEEIVHKHLNHIPTRVVLVADSFEARDYDKAQEEEAYGIGAAVLLPWASFFRGINAGHAIDELAEQYDVTPELIEYRIKITGAYRLYRSRQHA